jgi:hypothetical protein
MRYASRLRKRAMDGRVPLSQRAMFTELAAYIEALENALRRHRLPHDTICTSSGSSCNCGAEGYNRLIDNVLADGEMDAGRRRYR